jgi:hypothetical protein
MIERRFVDFERNEVPVATLQDGRVTMGDLNRAYSVLANAAPL